MLNVTPRVVYLLSLWSSDLAPSGQHVRSRTLIVDEAWTSVGSTNFDNRSLAINDEANLNVHDEDFARAQAVTFQADLAQSRKIEWDDWKDRPWQDKLLDGAARLLSSQL